MNSNKHIVQIALVMSVMLSFLVVPSCKKYTDPPPFFEENDDTVPSTSRKVLIIAIDGAVGKEVKSIAPPALTALLEHSKYSFDARTEDITTDGATWKTMMSGVSYSKHKIKDSNFSYIPTPGDDEHGEVANYPSFFTYILTSTRPELKTIVISPWNNLLTRLVPEAEETIAAVNDAAVKDSAVKRLASGNPDVLLVNFNSVNLAGKAGAFLASDAGYKAAVLQVDNYIGAMMQAMKARPAYNKNEEWLVIITSNHGGIGNSYGGNSAEEANVFNVYYNEKLTKQELRYGGFTGAIMRGTEANAIKAIVENDGGLYDPGSGEKTFQIKFRATATDAYPHFFSKCEAFRSKPGFTTYRQGNNWVAEVRTTNGSARIVSSNTDAIMNGKWRSITIVFANVNGKRYMRTYTDGVKSATEVEVTNLGNIASPKPLTIGYVRGDGEWALTFTPGDCRIFDVALTDQEIAQMECISDMNNHPKKSNLIGYWLCNDGYGGLFRNKAPGYTKDFVLQGNYKWDNEPELPCMFTLNPGSVSFFSKNADIAAQVLYWLRIPIKEDWSLDGSTWLTNFEKEFLGI